MERKAAGSARAREEVVFSGAEASGSQTEHLPIIWLFPVAVLS